MLSGGETVSISVTYDPTVDAMNVDLAPGLVAQTIEIEPRVLVDVDAQGQPLSVEFVVARDFFPFLTRHGGRLDAATVAELARTVLAEQAG